MATPTVIQSMIQAFRALQTPESRRQALDALVKELSPYEWRAVQSLANARSFQFDVVGKLPVELVALVFSNLDTSTPFRLQRVSRRWNTLLRSLDVLKRGLKPWCDGSNLEGGNYDLCAQTAQDIHRFRSGKYVDIVTKKDDGKLYIPNCTVLVEDLLVSVCSVFQRELFVDNLRTRSSWQAHGDARERITRIAASDEVVAFATTLNVCYVSDLHGGQRRSFRLNSVMFGVLTCRGRTIVCAGPFVNHVEVYIWDFDSQKGRSFWMSYDQPPFVYRPHDCHRIDLAILPNPTSQTLTVFSSKKRESRYRIGHDLEEVSDCSIHYARFTFDGHAISKGELLLPEFDGTFITAVRPVDRHGGFCVEVDALPRPGQLGEKRVSFQFDEVLQTFTELNHPVLTSPWYVNASTVWWKDSYYQVLPDSKLDPQLRHKYTKPILLAHLGTSNNFNFRPVLLDSVPTSETRRTLEGSNTRLLLNDRFAVVLDDAEQGSLHAISFQTEQK